MSATRGRATEHETDSSARPPDRYWWQQTWVDGHGTLLTLEGGLEDGDMVLRGERPRPTGTGVARHEIRWTPLPDGRVRQHWRVSVDGGGTWKDLFVGFYARR